MSVVQVTTVFRRSVEPLEVVVPVDGSADAQRATRLMSSLGDVMPVRAHLVTTRDHIGDHTPREYLEDLADRMGVPDPDIEVLLDHDPVQVAAEVAERHPGAHIALSVDPPDRIRGAIAPGPLGRLLENSPVPIIAFGPHVDHENVPGVGPVVVAVDAVEPDTSALAEGLGLAMLAGRPLHLVTVRQAPSGRVSTDRPFASVEDAVAPLAARARAAGIEARHSIEFADEAVEGLVRVAEADDALVIVAATHARHGLERLMEGSVGLDLVHRATAPVVLAHHDE
ncbi:MAG: universal stress protein [Actinomycetia bacterium]|nr:universal stress protein [Actinomycetes bacterium]